MPLKKANIVRLLLNGSWNTTTFSLVHRNLKHSFCLSFNIITTTLWSSVSRKKKISHNT